MVRSAIRSAGATLIGDDGLRRQIRAIGNDLALDPGIGNCGKQGNGCPWASACPALRDRRPDHRWPPAS